MSYILLLVGLAFFNLGRHDFLIIDFYRTIGEWLIGCTAIMVLGGIL